MKLVFRNLALGVTIFIALAARADYSLTTVYHFKSNQTVDPAGGGPRGGLGVDSNGLLYGTTFRGGTTTKNDFNAFFETGMVYSFDPVSGVQTPLANMDASGKMVPDPESNLVADSAGNLYGTTVGGGANGSGNIFMIAAGTHAVSTVFSFDFANSAPYGGVIPDGSGNLLGATSTGIYSVNISTHAFAPLATFSSANAGFKSYGNLFRDASGNLYGTNASGGANNSGTFFKMNGTTHALTVMPFNGTNGSNPQGGLVADINGNLYGTTLGGGANGKGTIFKVDHATGILSTLLSFDGTNGSSPMCTMLIDANGNLFGTTRGGTVFELDGTTHQLMTLATFHGSDGLTPSGSLVGDANGNLFGTTFAGGLNSAGTIFKLSPAPEPNSIGLLVLGATIAMRGRQKLRLVSKPPL